MVGVTFIRQWARGCGLGIINKIIAFGDTYGLPQLLKYVPDQMLQAVVGATIRPEQHQTLDALAKARNIPFLVQPKKSSSLDFGSFKETIAKFEPDLVIVHSYSMHIGPEILSIPPRGAINIHGALLPQYRGANPIQWAIINNQSKTGVTIHYMTDRFDAGDIIAQREVPIHEADTWLDVNSRIQDASNKLLATEVPKILTSINDRTPQDESKAHLWPRRKPEDGRIDWKGKSRDIYNLIRALVKPHPGAFYINDAGEKVVIDYFMTHDEVKEMQKRVIGYNLYED